LVAAVVRRAYLQDNEGYLSYSASLYDAESADPASARNLKSMHNILSWMEYNDESWRERCMGTKFDKNVHSVALEPFDASDLMLGIYTIYRHVQSVGCLGQAGRP